MWRVTSSIRQAVDLDFRAAVRGHKALPGAKFGSSLDNRKPARVLDARPILRVCKDAPDDRFGRGWERGLDRPRDAEQHYQEKLALCMETPIGHLTQTKSCPFGKHLGADGVPCGDAARAGPSRRVLCRRPAACVGFDSNGGNCSPAARAARGCSGRAGLDRPDSHPRFLSIAAGSLCRLLGHCRQSRGPADAWPPVRCAARPAPTHRPGWFGSFCCTASVK
jgi:hypothetical protein